MQGVDAIVQLKSSLPISAKVEINPKGFILGIKAKIEKIFLICPQVTNKCWTLPPCIGPKAELKEKVLSNLGSQFATLGGGERGQCCTIY